MKRALWAVVVLFSATPAFAEPGPDHRGKVERGQNGQPITIGEDTSAAIRKKEVVTATVADRSLDWTVLPGAFTSAETSFGVVLYGELSFYLEDLPSKSRRSKVDAAITATAYRQLIVATHPTLRFANDRWQVSADWSARRYPNRFYGIGNEASRSYQAYTERRLDFVTWAGYRAFDRLYLGPMHQLTLTQDMEIQGLFDDQGNELEGAPPVLDSSVPGVDSTILQGLGLFLAYDYRDSLAAPTKGGLYTIYLLGFPTFLGSDYQYLKLTADFRQYLTVPKTKVVFALQVLHEARFGEPPFFMLSEMGGTDVMRGLFKGRFRDKYMLSAQAETRFPLWWLLSGAFFISVGEVYGYSKFDLEQTQWTAGGGLRLQAGEELYIRMDYGLGPEGGALIFQGGQAF